MFFKRKPTNRRLNSRAVLDVKLRSDKIRHRRMRFSAVALAVSFGTLFGLYVLWRAGNWALNTFLYENRAFAIEQIEVETDGVISTDQLRRWSGVKRGENLLALDLTRVKRDIELIPIIQSASVERLLPRTLRVRVTERETVAQFYIPQPCPNGGYEMALFHLDHEGCVMLPLDPRQRSAPPVGEEHYPLIGGMNPSDVRPGRRIDSPQLRSAIELIVAFERSSMAGLVELQRIDISSPGILQVTANGGSEITFSVNDIDRQLNRWFEIYEQGRRYQKYIASLDLAVTNNIPARWVEASAAPFPAPKPVKSTRTRKKNV